MFSIFGISYYCYRHVYKLSNLYWFCLTGNVGGVCNFPGSVSLQQKLEVMDRPVLQLSFIWQAQENASLRHEGGPTQKTRGEEKNPPHPCSILAPLFICFFLLPLILLYANWASQEGCLFYPRLSLWSSNLPLFYFRGLFPSLSFGHHHSGLLYPILTT